MILYMKLTCFEINLNNYTNIFLLRDHIKICTIILKKNFFYINNTNKLEITIDISPILISEN